MYTYLIPKGAHTSRGPRFLFKRPNNIAFKIDSSFIHESSSLGWSKIFGYSDGWHHHRNSIRIAAMTTKNGTINVSAYYYYKAERSWIVLGEISPDTTYQASINWTKDKYKVSISGPDVESRTVEVVRGGCCITYPLFPYYGGSVSAPHPIKFYVEYL